MTTIYRCCIKPATKDPNFNNLNPDPSTSNSPHRIFNLGNSNTTELLNFIKILEEELGVEAIKEYLPIQPGDVEETAADTKAIKDWINFAPSTSLKTGIKCFAKWFLEYYKLN